ncbi:MAG: response regulator [Proteobacteria bacterium]|nr:response regulator [Pseudomonadota bacterium]
MLRALVVDDDATYRRILDQSLRRLGVTEVSLAGDTSLARGKLEREPFDIITIDVVLRGESGLDLLKWVRANYPRVTAILVTSGSQAQASSAVDGLLLGAAALIIKPSGPDASARLDAALKDSIAVVARTTGTIPRITTGSIPRVAAPPPPRIMARDLVPCTREVIAVGSSTGGPPAVLLFLSSLPPGFRTPILLTQHMPALHVPHFAALLRDRTGLAVAVAEHGERVVPGRIYVAPGGAHLRVSRQGAQLVLLHDDGPEEHFCKPAVDPMFRSVATACGAASIGVVLTGMGSDGALGAMSLRERGAPVLVQDKASSVVWGMPGAVVAKGAADVVAPIGELAQRVVSLSTTFSITRTA